MPDPLKDLTAAGVSIWLDDLSRRLLTSGALHRLVDERHVVGITSNPTIFANAIGGSADYADQIRELGQRGTPPLKCCGCSPWPIYAEPATCSGLRRHG
jgi:transaldolase